MFERRGDAANLAAVPTTASGLGAKNSVSDMVKDAMSLVRDPVKRMLLRPHG